MQSDGDSMYGHSDNGTYDDELEQKEILPEDWYENYAIPSVNRIVYRWLKTNIYGEITTRRAIKELLMRNPIIEYACSKQIDPSKQIPEFTKEIMVNLITEP